MSSTSVSGRTAFYYDPQRQGYDTTLWRRLYGQPTVQGNELKLTNSATIHYADIIRCEIVFNLSIPAAPAAGASRSFGLQLLNKGAYILFDITDTVFSAKTSDGTNSSSSAITWQSSWTAATAQYRIVWEAGTAKFYVNGTFQAAITDVSVVGDPMSVYLENGMADSLSVSYIVVKGIQYYILTQGPEDSTFEILLLLNDSVSISESVTVFQSNMTPSVSDAITITENVNITQVFDVSVSDAITITESVTVFQENMTPSVNDAVSIAESITVFQENMTPSVNDAITIVDAPTVTFT